jgi:hypothetical protein
MGKSLLSCALTALIVICIVGSFALAFAPAAGTFMQAGKAIGTALAGGK